MNAITRSRDDEYAEAFWSYLKGAGEEALQRAYEIGRRALGEGVGVLEMAELYHRTLASILLRARDRDEIERMLPEAEVFLRESLSPFEMAHRGYREAQTALRRLNEVLEDEAKRIAHALHDEAGQLLASVHLALEAVATDLPRSRPRLEEIRGLLQQIEDHLRRLSHELRPTILDDLGLVPALEFLAQGVSARSGLAITVKGLLESRLPAPMETALYRAVQEALTNAGRHARASAIGVAVWREHRRIHCTVRDDGKGFDPAEVASRKDRCCLGLSGIRERLSALGGSLTITTAPGSGTELLMTIPWED